MNKWFALSLVVISVIVVVSCRKAPASKGPDASAATPERGTIEGNVRLTETPPQNPVIRLNADPMCAKATGLKTALQEAVIVGTDGGLANVFVHLQGTFPETPAPTQPVTIDQRGCIYSPRMVGIQLGQPLQVLNSDPGLHNVHGVSVGRDAFNIAQPLAGMVNEFRMKEEGILRLQCDVHTWMVAFVGVVHHPYFAVSSAAGTFDLQDVPAGTYAIQAWHEQYGVLTQEVRVEARSVAHIDFTFSGNKKGTAPISD